jgi:surfactin family lipopeptide synthetase C
MIFADQPNKSKNIESIYPLSPMQEGMLFHSLYEAETGVYFNQLSFTIHGNLDVSAFDLAWSQVVGRHPALRTLFVWKNRTKQLQVVLKKVKLPWTNLDWRELSPLEQDEKLEVFLQADRNKGFELDKAPLTRCVLIQLAEETYKFVWSSHHLLTDGWCIHIIFKEVFAFYEALKTGFDLYLPPTRPYKDYIAWLQQQDKSKAIAYWQQTLQGWPIQI